MGFPSAFRLRFSDARLEARFLDEYNRTYIVQARFALGLAILLVGLDIAADVLMYPEVSVVGNRFRLFVLMPILGLGIAGSYAAPVRRNFEMYVMVWAFVADAALFGAMTMLERTGGQGLSSHVGILNFTFVQVFAFVLIGLRLPLATVLGLGMFVLFVAMLVLETAAGAGELAYTGYHLASIVALTFFIGYWRERYIRRDFLLRVELEEERERSDRVLHAVMPRRIAERLRAGEHPIADARPTAMVLFADIVGFTRLAAALRPRDVTALLERLFSEFDDAVARHRLEKIKTIGDGYMAATGLAPEDATGTDAAERIVRTGFELIQVVRVVAAETGHPLDLRVGAHAGPVIAGVIGRARYQYDVWGDTVNVASRLESTGVPGRVQVSRELYLPLRDCFDFESRGEIEVRGRGWLETYLVVAPAGSAVAAPRQ